jgi:uncharacterized membrane-anchored protein YhcB (DUF1043 family)
MNLSYNLLLLCLIITGIIIYFLRKRHLARKKLRTLLMEDVDESFDVATQNIVLSISKSKSLYKNLIKQVHPDKFHDDKKELATELSMKITKAKRNYKELVKLKSKVELFLNN